MKYGVLGTGDVARTISSKLIELGHRVMMGSRTATNEKAVNWATENGKNAACGTFADVASEPVTGFYCGNDNEAKEAVRDILLEFGWTDTFDLGDISMSRYTEMLGAFWVPVFGQLNTMHWGVRLIR